MAKTGKILSRSVKALFYLIIAAVNIIMLWRVLFSGDPSSIKTLMVNDSTLSAWEEHGEEMLVQTQEQRTLTASGLFEVRSCVFIPEAEQIQVTVRYNNSTLRRTAEEYGLSEVPERKNDIFDVTIVKTLDKTPDNPDDNTVKENLIEERYFPSEVKSAYKTLYSYRKFIFDGVTYEDAVGMFVDIYYNEDIDYDKTAYGTLCIYDPTMSLEKYTLSRADKKALENAEDK
ncbi:MAG: hypothetical protein IKT56_06605 [Clostridia bacterium]|nr:hypothetical protein [Clostridia bacterium]